jgi:serine/threonine-protein kinase RsbT
VTVVLAERVVVLDETHIVLARQAAARAAKKLGMGVLDQTKIATATSELARNIVRYAKTGEVLIEEVADALRSGLQITFKDSGPGIANIPKAMQDGFTTGRGMGFGLSGSTVVIRKWKNS